MVSDGDGGGVGACEYRSDVSRSGYIGGSDRNRDGGSLFSHMKRKSDKNNF